MNLTPLQLTIPPLPIHFCRQTTGADVETFNLCETCAAANCNDRCRVQEGVAATRPECDNCGYVPHSVTYNLYHTYAPTAYDGFGTVTLSARRDGERMERLVGIPCAPDEDSVEEWQIQRYGSGLYGATAFHAGLLVEYK